MIPATPRVRDCEGRGRKLCITCQISLLLSWHIIALMAPWHCMTLLVFTALPQTRSDALPIIKQCPHLGQCHKEPLLSRPCYPGSGTFYALKTTRNYPKMTARTAPDWQRSIGKLHERLDGSNSESKECWTQFCDLSIGSRTMGECGGRWEIPGIWKGSWKWSKVTSEKARLHGNPGESKIRERLAKICHQQSTKKIRKINSVF